MKISFSANRNKIALLIVLGCSLIYATNAGASSVDDEFRGICVKIADGKSFLEKNAGYTNRGCTINGEKQTMNNGGVAQFYLEVQTYKEGREIALSDEQLADQIDHGLDTKGKFRGDDDVQPLAVGDHGVMHIHVSETNKYTPIPEGAGGSVEFRKGLCQVNLEGWFNQADILKGNKITNPKKFFIELLKKVADPIASALDAEPWCQMERVKKQPTPIVRVEVQGDPVIDSFAPHATQAGYESDYYPDSGYAVFKTDYIKFEIHGKNLQGAIITTDNHGVDGQPGIVFQPGSVLVNKDGTMINGYFDSRPEAADGFTTVTITNNAGRSVSYQLKVYITGTHYLRRAVFSSPDLFKGDWRMPMPEQRVLDLENVIRAGLQSIGLNSYRHLDILPIVYEKSFWSDSVCGGDTPDSFIAGCAGREGRTINVREIDNMNLVRGTILHESAHKLDFFHRGEYRGIPDAPTTPDAFFHDWKLATGVVDTRTCRFLPLLNIVTWHDGSTLVPHCGMIVAYAASDLLDAIWDTGLYEDIATMTENFVFNHWLFTIPDATTDRRYDAKNALLKNYGFLP